MNISQRYHPASNMYPAGPSRYYRGDPDSDYPEEYPQQYRSQYRGPPATMSLGGQGPGPGAYGEVPPYESGYEPPPGPSAPYHGYHPAASTHGHHLSQQYSMAMRRSHPEISMMDRNHGSGYLMPWYGGPPRAYPIPPEHMYNMYQFNRYDSEDSKSACKILNGREARNRAEKNRRDKLNGSIQELSSMVPHVAESPRRIDKTAVLRFSAHALRVDYVFGKAEESSRSSKSTTPPPASPVASIVKSDLQDTLFRMLNGFLLTVTCRGQIVLVSASVEQFLGHCQTDLYGLNLFNLIHPDDHNLLKQQLIPSNLGNLFDGSVSGHCSRSSMPTSPPPTDGGTGDGSRPTTNNNSSSSSTTSDTDFQTHRSHEEEEEIDRKLRQDRRKFSIRIARAGPRSEPVAYELVTVDGCFRRADAAPRGSKQSGPSGLQLLRRARGREDGISLHSINGNDIVLVAMVRVMKMPTICDRLIEACKYEYKTRHLIDGRIVQCDHRISVVAGYLTNEVSGLSPFTFMHKDDVRWVIVALRQMYDCQIKNGESCYRLMTRTGDFIYLKTTGYLEIDSTSKIVQSFVCINRLVSEEEGRRLVREMKQKYSVMVNQLELPDESNEPTVENPTQIERAVMNLITNLHPNEDDSAPIPRLMEPPESDQLSIIAPKPSQVKSAIVKSIHVVAVASKKMNENGGESPLREGSTCSSPSAFTQEQRPANTERPSVLQKVDSKSSVPECHRVPPLPGSEHYFTQPISPYSTASTCSSSVLSPASQHVVQRNSRSPFGGSIPPMSPPATGMSSTIYTRVHSVDSGSGQCRTTSVLKRTYSNSSMNIDDTGSQVSELIEMKRCKQSSTNLNACLSELVNPATNLITSLPNAFDAVDKSLMKIENKTAMIREQVSNYQNLQHSQMRLSKIVEEQQEQREMLQSIQQEYTFQIQSNGNPHKVGNSGVATPQATVSIDLDDAESVASTTVGMMMDDLGDDDGRNSIALDPLGADELDEQLFSPSTSPSISIGSLGVTASVITSTGRSSKSAARSDNDLRPS